MSTNITYKNPPTIHELRKSGYKVRVIHKEITRISDFDSVPDEEVSRIKVGRIKSFTKIDITTPDGRDTSGFAFCYVGDQYNRKLGNRIALGRALKNL